MARVVYWYGYCYGIYGNVTMLVMMMLFIVDGGLLGMFMAMVYMVMVDVVMVVMVMLIIGNGSYGDDGDFDGD